MTRSYNHLVSSISCACGVVIVCMMMSGCTPQEEKNAAAAFDASLTSLVQNRTLAEQFVRDVKTSCDPSDPSYQQARESYDQARDSYNRFLDTVESGSNGDRSTLRESQVESDAKDSSADFLKDATRALQPSVSTRGLEFRRAISIPDNLQVTLHKLPKRARESLVAQVDNQVRWRSWGEM